MPRFCGTEETDHRHPRLMRRGTFKADERFTKVAADSLSGRD